MKSYFRNTIALLVFLLPLAGYSQEFKTEVKVSKGLRCEYTTEMNTDVAATQQGMEMKMSDSRNFTTRLEVDDVLSSGNVEVYSSIWDMSSRSKVMGVDTAMVNKGQVGSTYKSEIDKYGTIISFVKMESGKSQNEGAFALSKLTNAAMFCEFPKKNVAVGEKWNKVSDDSISMVGFKTGMTINTDYVLAGIETIDGKSFRKVTYTSNIEIGGKGKIQGMDMFMEGAGADSGSIYLDPETKIIYEKRSDIEMEMSMTITGQQNLTIPVSQKMKITQKLKK